MNCLAVRSCSRLLRWVWSLLFLTCVNHNQGLHRPKIIAVRRVSKCVQLSCRGLDTGSLERHSSSRSPASTSSGIAVAIYVSPPLALIRRRSAPRYAGAFARLSECPDDAGPGPTARAAPIALSTAPAAHRWRARRAMIRRIGSNRIRCASVRQSARQMQPIISQSALCRTRRSRPQTSCNGSCR